jgi:SAM-dependent methyltransferase
MMKKDSWGVGIHKALKLFGGFVRYYDTTEPLQKLAALVSAGNCRNILACCGGGDQALTMLGAGGGRGALWVVDTNPAQLFVLAAKALFLKQKKLMPSFGQLRQAYPGRITAVKKNIRRLQQVHLCHMVTGKIIAPPAGLAERYAFIMDDEMFVLSKSGPFWKEDLLFMARVRAGLGLLRFARMDIFDSPDYFKQGSLDLIYISDIFWSEALAYYQLKLAKMAGLLRPGGRIISHLDGGDDFMGQGVSPGRVLAGQARDLALKMDTDQANGYLVLERMRRG